jgi:hypothetical protein
VPVVSVDGGGGGGWSSGFLPTSVFFFGAEDVVPGSGEVVVAVSDDAVVVLASESERGFVRVSLDIGGVVLPIVSITMGALELAIPFVSVRGWDTRRTGAVLGPAG